VTAPRFTVPRDDRRDCALYRIMVLDPRTNYTTVTLGYIGETGRMPFTRFVEHLYDQPFGDTIVGHPHVDPRAFAGKAQVLAAEEAAVRAEKPLYNIEYQKGAPHQIPQWTAREQRAERDRRRGTVTPNWAAKGSVPRVDPGAPDRSMLMAVLRSQWTWWATAWLISAAFAWETAGWAVDGIGQKLTAGPHLLLAAFAGPIGYVAVRVWWAVDGKQRWRRWARRRR
jgi:hypothetical protein